jgi:hypothetical protein
MTRWFVGVKPDGGREMVEESTGTNPTALRGSTWGGYAGGYVELCGPYKTRQEAGRAKRAKSSPNRGSTRPRRQPMH